jgi:hypothetical protein
MKYIYALIIPLLLLSLYGGCGGSGGSNELICSPEEMQDRFAETECIAEELITGCVNIECLALGEPTISVGRFGNRCTLIDCETLECEPISISPSSVVSGFLTELVIDEMNGLPAGVFNIDGIEDTPFE